MRNILILLNKHLSQNFMIARNCLYFPSKNSDDGIKVNGILHLWRILLFLAKIDSPFTHFVLDLNEFTLENRWRIVFQEFWFLSPRNETETMLMLIIRLVREAPETFQFGLEGAGSQRSQTSCRSCFLSYSYRKQDMVVLSRNFLLSPTLPAGTGVSVDYIRFGVLSCGDWESGAYGGSFDSILVLIHVVAILPMMGV